MFKVFSLFSNVSAVLINVLTLVLFILLFLLLFISEKKRGDQEVQNLFETLEVTTELQSGQIEKLVNTCDEQFPTINANLLVAQSMCNKILDQAKNSELVSSLRIKWENIIGLVSIYFIYIFFRIKR